MHPVRGLAFGLVCLLLLPALASGQESGYYVREDVRYYYAVGDVDSGHASLGLAYDGGQRVPFFGCAWAKMRPDNDLGRINTIATVGRVPFEIQFNEFHGARQDMLGGIAEDILVDGSRTHGSIQHPAVRASVAAWGNASLEVDGVEYADPATGGYAFAATWFVTDQGFRDDETGAILASDGSPYTPGDAAVRGQGDWEMHLRIESKGDATAGPTVSSVREPPEAAGPLARGYLPPDEDHRNVYTHTNDRYGGDGTITVEASTLAPEGENDLHFTVYAPDGTVVAALDAQPSSTAGFEESSSFDLDQFGGYVVEVTGRVSLAQYAIEFRQSPPERFDLNMWWDNVTFGAEGPAAKGECEELVRGESLTGYVPARPAPPGFPWLVVLMAVAGSATTLLVAVKFTMMARAAAVHRDASRDA